MAEILYISRYDRHCLDKLLGTSTEARLWEEGHVFTLSDGTEWNSVEFTQTRTIVATGLPPVIEPEPEQAAAPEEQSTQQF